MEATTKKSFTELSAKELFMVAGAGDHTAGDNGEHWEDIGFSGGNVNGNLGMAQDGFNDFGDWLNDLGSDLGGWAYDTWG